MTPPVHAAALPLVALIAAGCALGALAGWAVVGAHKHRRARELRRRATERAKGDTP